MTKQDAARERVRDMIEQLAIGEAIPSERQLCVDLGISRLTLRAALDELVREGYLVRRRGSGTFVSDPKIAPELAMTSVGEDMVRRGVAASSKTLDLSIMPAGARLGRVLRVSPSEPIVVAKRLRLADELAIALETLHLRASLVPGLSASDLEGDSFNQLLSDRYGIVIASGYQTIEPIVTSAEESVELGWPPCSPAFLFERTTKSDSGEIVEFVRSIYRGDRYRIMSELVADEA